VDSRVRSLVHEGAAGHGQDQLDGRTCPNPTHNIPCSEKNTQPPRRQGYQDSQLLPSKRKNPMAPCRASALPVRRFPAAQSHLVFLAPWRFKNFGLKYRLPTATRGSQG
jgi:hypothetical protein